MPFFELIWRVFQGLKVLRAIFSTSYRKELQSQWSKQPKLYMYEECFGAFLGIVSILGLSFYLGLSQIMHKLYCRGRYEEESFKLV